MAEDDDDEDVEVGTGIRVAYVSSHLLILLAVICRPRMFWFILIGSSDLGLASV